jgi:type IV secretory pathway TraG/TraD family ATPase VirD4
MYVKLRDGDAHLGTVRDLATEAEAVDEDDVPIAGLRATAAHAIEMGHPRLSSLAARYLRQSRSNSDVVATFDAATRWLLDDDIRTDLSARNGIDFAALKDDPPKTVFAIRPAGTELSFFAPWLRIVTNCAFDSLYGRGGEGLPVIFMVSEAAQLGRLEGLLACIGQGRKYGIRLAPIVWQDISQAREVYGQNGASTLTANSGCLFAFNPGNDAETAEFLSRLGGDHLVPGLSAVDDPVRGVDHGSISPQRERLWPPEKIRSLPERHGLVWKAGQAQPQPVYCPPYWDIEACRRVARPDPYHSTLPTRQTAAGANNRVALVLGIPIALIALVVLLLALAGGYT